MSHPMVAVRRRTAVALALALSMHAGTGALVHAQSSAPPVSDPCALLTDQEVLEATGAAAITRTEAVSSLSIAGYGAGCTRQLEPPGGLPANATFTLEYGVQAPGGRQVYDDQLAVTPGATHVGGLGDDAFQGLSDEWYAVKGDATVGLSLLGIGLPTDGLHRGDIARRALLWRLMSRLPADPSSQDVTGPVCLLDPGELTGLVALPFGRVSAGDLNCLYAGGPVPGGYALDIRLEDPPIGSSDANLDLMSLGSGEATTVAGMPAWTSDEALWVDLGVRLLVVQPMWLPLDASRPIGDVLASVAQGVVERLPAALADPTPEPTPMSDGDLASLFPSDLRGSPVTVRTIAGQDIAGQLAGPAAEAMSAVIAGQGRTIDDLSLGLADLFNASDRDGTIIAIRLRGADAATFGIPLLLATQGAPELPIGRTPATVAGKDVLVLDVPGVDAARAIHAYARGDIAWFVTATTCTRYTPERGCEAEELDRPLLEEILRALP